MTFRRLLVIVFFAATLWPASARADIDGDKAKAEALLREAAALYRQGDREAAVAKFEQAYAVYPSPKILYNLGKAYLGIDQPQKARDALAKFLREADEVSPARRKEVEALVAKLDEELAAEEAATGTEKVATVDETPSDDSVITPPVPTPKQAAETTGAEPVPVVIVDDRRDRDEPPLYTRWWLWAGVGAAVAGTVAIIALSSGGDATYEPATGSLGNCTFGQPSLSCSR